MWNPDGCKGKMKEKSGENKRETVDGLIINGFLSVLGIAGSLMKRL